MADVNLEIDLDQQGLRQETRRAERTLEQMEKRLSRKRARARLKRVRADRAAEQRITREREREEQARLTMERRLSRRRARNRLRQMRERRRQEALIEREAERERERRRERRRRITRGATRVAGRGASIIGGGALGAFGSLFDSEQVLEFGRSVAVLAGAADLSRKEQAKLAKLLTDVNVQTGVRRTDVLRGFEAIIEKSGDFGLAEQTILAISKASVGLNADMEDLGFLAAALGTSFGDSAGEVIRFFEVLAAQGDKGKVTLRDLASIGEDIFVTAAGVGLTDEKSLISLGAILQSGIGSADERKTQLTGFLAALADPKVIEKAFPGVKVRGKDNLPRDPGLIFKEIIRSTKGETAPIKKALGDPFKLFLSSAGAFSKTGNFDDFNDFLNLGAGSKGLIDKRFTRVEETASVVTLDKLQGLASLLSDKALAPALDAMAEALNDILENDVLIENLAKGVKNLGVALGFLMKAVSGVLGTIGFVGSLGGLLDDDDEVKAIPKKLPTSTGKPSSSIQQKNSSIGLSVNNNITIDDRGNVKKSRTRVDTQNNPALGRTLGSIS